MDRQMTAERMQAEYQRGKAYNEGIGLYEAVRRNERFFEGNQWDGVKTREIRPITMNFLDQIGHYKVSQIVSEDVGQQIEPFLPDETAQQAATILTQSIDRVVERQKIKARHHELLRNAFVDGDAALYFYFNAGKETGFGGVSGEIEAESLMNTNVLFGNPACRETQRQPYILIVRRRPVCEARREAKARGCAEWESIQGESEGIYKGDDEQNDVDSLCTELTRFWRGEDGCVRFCKCIGRVLTQPETATGMTLYPLAYISWKPRQNSYHGVRELDALINTQISVNKQWTALDMQLRSNAMPKLVYDMRKFPDGWKPEAQTIGIMGDVREALTGVAGSMPIPTEATSITQNMLETAKNCAGANDAALGNIKNPDNTSAIVAAQTASSAPLSLTRLAYWQFVEDYTRVLIDMMHAYYGIRTVKVTDKAADPLTGADTELTRLVDYDFAALPVDAMDLKIDIGAASYWAQNLQTATLDNLMRAGVIPSAADYLERLPEGTVKDRQGLIDAIRSASGQQAAQDMQGVPDGGALGEAGLMQAAGRVERLRQAIGTRQPGTA